MADITFGLKGLNNNTPKTVKWVYRISGLATTLWTLVISTYPDIPKDLQLGVLKALGLVTAILYTLCQFAGYADDGKTETKTEHP